MVADCGIEFFQKPLNKATEEDSREDCGNHHHDEHCIKKIEK